MDVSCCDGCPPRSRRGGRVIGWAGDCHVPRCDQPGHRGRRDLRPARLGGGDRRGVARARAAFPAWRDVAPGDRARLLRRFAEAVDADRENLAAIEVENAGHTIGNARWEAGNARDVIAYYSGAPERLIGQQIPVAGGLDFTIHEPLGVVGAIVPWNFPMPIASWAFAPALAAGNSVVLKPAELTPLTALRLAELARRRASQRTCSRCCRAPAASRGSGSSTHPDVARCLHRLDGGRQAGHGRLRAARQAGDAGAGRQERQRRVRRRRPGGPRRPPPGWRLRQRRAGLLRALPDPRRGERLRPVHGAVGDGRPRCGRRRPGATRSPRWAR